ncbi:hypothetical protein K469DRAFT_166472, partial [Zopfia rhizophila CBS 207.26]
HKLTNYDQSVADINEAIRYLKTLPNPNVRSYAEANNLPYQRLLRAYKGDHNKKTRPKTNLLLTNA